MIIQINNLDGAVNDALRSFSGAFKDMAKEFDVPFVCLAQINRGVEGQTNKRPTMADIKDNKLPRPLLLAGLGSL
ncbi:MAG: DnaB-like helicase C-terminal domain-containing protein [Coleofasciculus sp. G2-EDA-02]